MKKKTAFIAIFLTAIASAVGVTTIAKNRMTPTERYLESPQAFGQIQLSSGNSGDSNYIPKEIINDEGNLKYEFLSYELIDDKDINKQTKYKAEYFIDGKVPSSDYVVKWTDFDAMARDFPKFSEYRDSNCERGMTRDEYERFMREHEAEYTTDKHIKSKYLFVKCRITYTGNGRPKEWLSNFSIFAMRNNQVVGQAMDFCYFDLPQPALWDGGRDHDFFWYKFNKAGDSIECIIGCRLREDEVDFSGDNTYYIGIEPSVYYDDQQINPALNARFVSTDMLPRESN